MGMLRFSWFAYGWSLIAVGTLVSLFFLLPSQRPVPFGDAEEETGLASAPRWFHPRGNVSTAKLVSLGGHFHGVALLWPGPTVVGANHLGIFLSGDRGVSWQLLDPDLALHGTGHVVGTTDGTVLVVVGEGVGLRRSEDGGVTWKSIGQGLPPEEVTAMALDPRSGERLALWMKRLLALSEDGGRTWSRVTPETAPPPILSLAVHPERPEQLYAGTEHGVWVSLDGGHTWSPLAPGAPRGPVLSLAVPPTRPDLVLAGTEEGPFVSGLGGSPWRSLRRPLDELGPIVAFAFDPRNPGRVFAMTHEGQVLRHSLPELLAFGQTGWTALHLTPAPAPGIEVPEEEVWVTP